MDTRPTALPRRVTHKPEVCYGSRGQVFCANPRSD